MENNIKVDFDDLLIVPNKFSSINSRKEIDIYDENGMLPLITAPMDTVISNKNEKLFYDNKVNTCLPRGLNSDYGFTSISLNEFIDRVDNGTLEGKILVDIANGHMRTLYEYTKKALDKFDNLTLMIGNVANPDTFLEYAILGVHYVRVGIGNGNGCLTTQQTGIGYPMASLIRECNEARKSINTNTKIVADGGMKKYSDIIKSLYLGADYVMIGSLFNKALESHSDKYIKHKDEYIKIDEHSYKHINLNEKEVYSLFRGMSTKEVQRAWNKEKLTTSEGIVKYNKVEYTLNGFINNFSDYLRSSMSYTNNLSLADIKKNGIKVISVTQNAFKRYNK